MSNNPIMMRESGTGNAKPNVSCYGIYDRSPYCYASKFRDGYPEGLPLLADAKHGALVGYDSSDEPLVYALCMLLGEDLQGCETLSDTDGYCTLYTAATFYPQTLLAKDGVFYYTRTKEEDSAPILRLMAGRRFCYGLYKCVPVVGCWGACAKIMGDWGATYDGEGENMYRAMRTYLAEYSRPDASLKKGFSISYGAECLELLYREVCISVWCASTIPIYIDTEHNRTLLPVWLNEAVSVDKDVSVPNDGGNGIYPLAIPKGEGNGESTYYYATIGQKYIYINPTLAPSYQNITDGTWHLCQTALAYVKAASDDTRAQMYSAAANLDWETLSSGKWNSVLAQDVWENGSSNTFYSYVKSSVDAGNFPGIYRNSSGEIVKVVAESWSKRGVCQTKFTSIDGTYSVSATYTSSVTEDVYPSVPSYKNGGTPNSPVCPYIQFYFSGIDDGMANMNEFQTSTMNVYLTCLTSGAVVYWQCSDGCFICSTTADSSGTAQLLVKPYDYYVKDMTRAYIKIPTSSTFGVCSGWACWAPFPLLGIAKQVDYRPPEHT